MRAEGEIGIGVLMQDIVSHQRPFGGLKINPEFANAQSVIDVSGIPTLLVYGKNGDLLTKNGRDLDALKKLLGK